MRLRRLVTTAVVTVLVLAGLTSCASVVPTVFDAEVADYLRQWAEPFPMHAAHTATAGAGDQSDAATAVPFDPGDARLVMTGERHGTAHNYLVDLAMFSHLVREHGFSAYVAETGVAFGVVVDNYLRTGDVTMIDAAITMVRQSSAYSVEHRDHFVAMRELYLSLPEEERFTYIGVDVEHALAAPVPALLSLAEDSDHPQLGKLSELFARFEEGGYPVWGDEDEGEIRAEIARLAGAFADGELTAVFGSNAETAELVLNAARAAYAFYDTDRAEGYDAAAPGREAAIVDHFATHADLLGGDRRYFGQWGGFHVHKRPVHGSATLASMTNASNGLFPDGVTTVLLAYAGSFYRNARSGDRLPIRDQVGAYLAGILEGSAIVDLRRNASPFAEALYFVHGGEPGTVTTDYVDYVLLVAGSPAVTTFSE